jgi:DNA-binding transcriptional MerR regulator/methylmalonyl-CoA mutase cobalamin-binding subunit
MDTTKQITYTKRMEPSKGIYPIRVVARKTGLTPFVIRSWEKRHSAVVPYRSETNRRLYSDADVTRLNLLSKAVNAGHSISSVASLSNDELESILEAERDPSTESAGDSPPGRSLGQQQILARCLEALASLDPTTFEEHLETALTNLSLPVFLEAIIAPLMAEAGRKWQSGEWRIAHEHLASAVVRRLLLAYPPTNRLPGHAPLIVIATPAGQTHEIGALMARSIAVADGWRDLYLGPDTPAAEIAHAVKTTDARAIALSIVYPPDDPHLPEELNTLARQLPEGIGVVLGGAAAPSYQETIRSAGFVHVESLAQLRHELARLRV